MITTNYNKVPYERFDEKPKLSVSSIANELKQECELFMNTINKSTIPVKIDTIDNKTCIRIVKPTESSNKFGKRIDKELVLTPADINDGIRLSTNYPNGIIFPYVNNRYSFPMDELGNSKYIRKFDENGDEIIDRFQGLRYSLYEINPKYKGGVIWKINDPKGYTTPCIIKDNDTKTWIKGTFDINSSKSTTKRSNLLTSIKDIVFVKIKAYEESAKIFRYGKLKKKMFESNSLFVINDILIDYTCKEDSLIRDVVEVIHEGRSYKFIGAELEFIYPDVSQLTKGFSLPKDRKIRTGITAKVIDNRGLNIPKNSKVTVGENLFKDYFKVSFDKKDYKVRKQQLKVI